MLGRTRANHANQVLAEFAAELSALRDRAGKPAHETLQTLTHRYSQWPQKRRVLERAIRFPVPDSFDRVDLSHAAAEGRADHPEAEPQRPSADRDQAAGQAVRRQPKSTTRRRRDLRKS